MCLYKSWNIRFRFPSLLQTLHHFCFLYRLACGIIARSAGLFKNPKQICACDGVTIWEERDRPIAGKGRSKASTETPTANLWTSVPNTDRICHLCLRVRTERTPWRETHWHLLTEGEARKTKHWGRWFQTAGETTKEEWPYFLENNPVWLKSNSLTATVGVLWGS